MEDYEPIVANFQLTHPRETLRYLHNTPNNTGAYARTKYPRETFHREAVVAELYEYVSGETLPRAVIDTPPPVVYSHHILKRESTFVVFQSKIVNADYIKTLNTGIRYHNNAWVSLPGYTGTYGRKFARAATTATFLLLVNTAGDVLGYYRLSWVALKSTHTHIKLTSTPNKTHPYIACVGVPFFSFTNENILDLNLTQLPIMVAGETESCVLAKFKNDNK